MRVSGLHGLILCMQREDQNCEFIEKEGYDGRNLWSVGRETEGVNLVF